MTGLNFESAIRSGIISSTVVFILLLAARNMRLCAINYLQTLGAAFTQKNEAGNEMLGFLLYMATGALLALLYAVSFSIWQASGWWRGLLLSIPHLAVTISTAAVLVKTMPGIKEKIWPAPSAEHHHPIYTLLVIIVLHIVFGSSMGIFYQL